MRNASPRNPYFLFSHCFVFRVSQLCPGAVLQKLDKLVEPLKLTCTTKVKANSVKQEYEKQDELKRSAMRAVAALMNIAGADKHPQVHKHIHPGMMSGTHFYLFHCS